jgi:hypothetical protein
VTVLRLDRRWDYFQACCREGIPHRLGCSILATDG